MSKRRARHRRIHGVAPALESRPPQKSTAKTSASSGTRPSKQVDSWSAMKSPSPWTFNSSKRNATGSLDRLRDLEASHYGNGPGYPPGFPQMTRSVHEYRVHCSRMNTVVPPYPPILVTLPAEHPSPSQPLLAKA